LSNTRAADTLRTAAADDVDAISRLRVEFWEDQVNKGLLDLRPFDIESLCAETRGFIGRQRTHLLIVERESEILAYIYGQIKIVPGATQSRVAVIEEMYVHRSRSTVSMALVLIRAMIERLIEAGAERIQCRVLFENKEGKALQEACGFRPNLVVYEYPL
jgi:hypothetical protein